MPIRWVTGDLFANAYKARAFAQGCNCQGSMGAGIAKGFRQRYPTMFEEYRSRVSRGDLGCVRQDHLQDRGSADHLFKHRGPTELFTQDNVLSSYFFLRLLAIFDVRACAVPSSYVFTFIFKGI